MVTMYQYKNEYPHDRCIGTAYKIDERDIDRRILSRLYLSPGSMLASVDYLVLHYENGDKYTVIRDGNGGYHKVSYNEY